MTEQPDTETTDTMREPSEEFKRFEALVKKAFATPKTDTHDTTEKQTDKPKVTAPKK